MTSAPPPDRPTDAGARLEPRRVHWVKKLHDSHPPRFWVSIVSVGIIVVFAAMLLVRTSREPQTLMSVSARTEIITVTVKSAADMMIPLNNALLSSVDEALDHRPGSCVSGFFSPAPGALVSIGRVSSGPLRILISPGPDGDTGAFKDEKRVRSYRGQVLIVLGSLKSKCAPPPEEVRIPIGGPVVLGNDYGPQTQFATPRPTLLSAQVNIFERATPPAWWWPRIGKLEDSLYPAGSLDLPAGTRLRECDGKASWWGFVDAHLAGADPADRAMTVALTTNAHRLALTTAGGSKTEMHPTSVCEAPSEGAAATEDFIAVSMFARLFGDPYVTILWLVLGTVLVTIQLILGALAIPSLEHAPKPPRKKTK